MVHWLRHLLGAVGGSASLGLALSPLPAIRTARATGNLGGLDTRAFTVFFACNLVGVAYGVKLESIWIFLSTLPSTLIFLHYCLTALRLLAQEEGEVSQLAVLVAKAGLAFRKDGQEPSAEHRQRELWQTELGLLSGLAGAACLCYFANGHRLAFDAAQFSMCTLAFAYPLPRLWGLVQRRDASPIFLPLCVGQGLNNLTWLSFGVLQQNLALVVPHAFGAVTVLLQLAVVLAFGRCEAAGAEGAVEEGRQGLPDLEPLVRRCGSYEEYLQWQRTYREWRRGKQAQAGAWSLPGGVPEKAMDSRLESAAEGAGASGSGGAGR